MEKKILISKYIKIAKENFLFYKQKFNKNKVEKDIDVKKSKSCSLLNGFFEGSLPNNNLEKPNSSKKHAHNTPIKKG